MNCWAWLTRKANDFDSPTPEVTAAGAELPEQSGTAVLPSEGDLEPEISESNVAIAEEESCRFRGDAHKGPTAIPRPRLVPPRTVPARVPFSRDALREAIDLVRQMDPIGVGARDLRECLLAQLHDLKRVDRKQRQWQPCRRTRGA